MRCQSVLVLVLPILTIVVPMPSELASTKMTIISSSSSTTARLPSTTTTTRTTTPKIGETLKQLTDQLLDVNTTDIVTLDIRTPPKIKQQLVKNQKHKNAHTSENSHAGIAIPINADEVHLEDEAATKKLNFYKIERPTTTSTTSGLSTWVFLSGQTTSTAKPARKPAIKPINETQNTTLIGTSMKPIKPVFKKRITTTRKPFSPKPTRSTTIKPSSTTSTTTTMKLTKIKASILNNAITKKSTTSTTTAAPTTTLQTQENATVLPLEAKDGDTDLMKVEEKQTKRPSTKRKKNKNRRRRPGDNKTETNSTKIEKSKIKPKPIGTQLYNYLSREVVPTVSLGLVGLMAAAGLTYFFYPFGVARRSYEIDRRVDNNNNNYYYDEYSTAIAEEEAIGKVIAGMPENTLFGNIYKQPTSRMRYQTQQPQVDHRILQRDQNDYNYQEFVVGAIPTTLPTTTTEDVTPVSVPEHGPRNLKLRRKRQLHEYDEKENEILDDFKSTTVITTTTPTSVPMRNKSIFDLITELLRLKLNLGLELIQNATRTVSKYVSHVQRRLDQHYRNTTTN